MRGFLRLKYLEKYIKFNQNFQKGWELWKKFFFWGKYGYFLEYNKRKIFMIECNRMLIDLVLVIFMQILLVIFN